MKKDFDVIYSEICENGGTELSKLNKKNLIKILEIFFIIIFLVVVLYNTVAFEITGFFIIVGVICLFGVLFKNQEKYINSFKNVIISRFISLYNSDLHYDYKFSFKEIEYKNSKLPEKFDVFKSCDGIYGKVSDTAYLKMSHIITQRKEERIVEGQKSTEKIETFNGIFGYAKLKKNINTSIFINSNDFKKKYNAKRIELESSEFEKNFDCFSDNKIIALQIFTPEVIEVINSLYSNLRKPLQIRIEGDTIYFRFLVENLCVPPKFSSPIDKARLSKLYNEIDFCYNLVECISNSVYENI